MKKGPLTIKDIAKALSISPSTVSRSLADHPDISKETKGMVLAYAKEHKYKPNPLATSLRTNQNKMIGVILPEVVHFFFSTVLSGIEDEAEKEGFRILVSHTREDYKKEVRAAQTMLEARVSGVLASVAKSTDEYEHFQELIDNDIPLVFFDRICKGILTDRVVVDDYNGVYSAVGYLIETGCRRVAFFGSPSQLAISNNRRMGYEDALIRNGIPVDPELIIICDNYEDALEMTEKMLSLSNPPDAFFAVNDETAIGILNKAKTLGYRIPEDISVVGFDNLEIARVINPPLTTVSLPNRQIGNQAAKLLLEGRKNERASAVVLPCPIIERESVRMLPK